jgi:hypothetical protein
MRHCEPSLRSIWLQHIFDPLSQFPLPGSLQHYNIQITEY